METNVIIDKVEYLGIEMDYCKFGNGNKNFVIIPGLSIKPVTPLGVSLSEKFKNFTEEYTIYLFDYRTNLPYGYSINDMAKDLIIILKYLGINKADFFGASLGGMVLQTIAILEPELVNKMFLGSTLVKANDTIKNVMHNWIILANNKEKYELNKSISETIYSENTYEAYKDILLSQGNDISDIDLRKFSILADAIQYFDVSDKIETVKCPIFASGATNDKVTTFKSLEELVEMTKCKHLYYGSEYGHAVYDEAPDFIENIYKFITD